MENTALVEAELGRWKPVDLAFVESLSLRGPAGSIQLDGPFQKRSAGSQEWPNIHKPLLRVSMLFEGVSQFELKKWNGVTQVMGFDIVKVDKPGWENGPTLHVLDYEDGVVEFFARGGTILAAEWAALNL